MENTRHVFECGICHNVYNEKNNKPLSLPCGHVFCEACLSKCTFTEDGKKNASMKNKTYIMCPSDNRLHFVAKEDLPCCYAILINLPSFTEDRKKDIYCVRHPTKKIKFFCESHNEFLCTVCVINHAGPGHMVSSFSVNEEKMKEDFGDVISKFEEILGDSMLNKSCLETKEKKLMDFYTCQLNKLNMAFDSAIKIINEKRKHFTELLKHSLNEQKRRFDSEKFKYFKKLEKLNESYKDLKDYENKLNKVHYEEFYKFMIEKTNQLKALNELAINSNVEIVYAFFKDSLKLSDLGSIQYYNQNEIQHIHNFEKDVATPNDKEKSTKKESETKEGRESGVAEPKALFQNSGMSSHTSIKNLGETSQTPSKKSITSQLSTSKIEDRNCNIHSASKNPSFIKGTTSQNQSAKKEDLFEKDKKLLLDIQDFSNKDLSKSEITTTAQNKSRKKRDNARYSNSKSKHHKDREFYTKDYKLDTDIHHLNFYQNNKPPMNELETELEAKPEVQRDFHHGKSKTRRSKLEHKDSSLYENCPEQFTMRERVLDTSDENKENRKSKSGWMCWKCFNTNSRSLNTCSYCHERRHFHKHKHHHERKNSEDKVNLSEKEDEQRNQDSATYSRGGYAHTSRNRKHPPLMEDKLGIKGRHKFNKTSKLNQNTKIKHLIDTETEINEIGANELKTTTNAYARKEYDPSFNKNYHSNSKNHPSQGLLEKAGTSNLSEFLKGNGKINYDLTNTSALTARERILTTNTNTNNIPNLQNIQDQNRNKLERLQRIERMKNFKGDYKVKERAEKSVENCNVKYLNPRKDDSSPINIFDVNMMTNNRYKDSSELMDNSIHDHNNFSKDQEDYGRDSSNNRSTSTNRRNVKHERHDRNYCYNIPNLSRGNAKSRYKKVSSKNRFGVHKKKIGTRKKSI